jgi:hypothetical protein
MDLLIALNSVPLSGADAIPTSGTPQYATDGSPPGTPATQFPAYHYNGMMTELINLIEGPGIALNRAVLTQVLQAVGRLAGSNAVGLGASTVLTADNAGLVVVTATTGNLVFTLPAAAAANGTPIKYRFVRTDSTSHSVEILCVGTDTIFYQGASMLIPPGGIVDIQSNGVNAWGPSISFGNWGSVDLAVDGYIKLPQGLILQWGVIATNTGGSETVYFPTSFPTACVALVATIQSSSFTGNGVIETDITSASGFAAFTGNGSGGQAGPVSALFLAIGY